MTTLTKSDIASKIGDIMTGITEVYDNLIQNDVASPYVMALLSSQMVRLSELFADIMKEIHE